MFMSGKQSFVICLVLLSACAANPPKIASNNNTQHPFIGCWESEDGLAREVWSGDPSGWLFGYAVNRDAQNNVKFFEQMRFDGETLFVSGPNENPTAFKRVESGTGIVFEKPDHDFPQRITYFPAPGRLDTEISMMDNSNKIVFKKTACKAHNT